MFDVNQAPYLAFRSILKERTNNAIAWIGSGLGVPAGLPAWPALRNQLCDAARNKAATLESSAQKKLLELHDLASREPNYWLSFNLLKKALGPTSYRHAIRNSLRGAETCPVPAIYTALWKLRPFGVLNLNLDRLATRAHSEVYGGSTLHEFGGKAAGKFAHLLKGQKPFVANLHGTVDDESSWVFTSNELQTLLKNPGYKHFIEACLAARTILFLGISADDTAAGGHLERLSRRKVDVGPHFWITDRRDSQTDQWAESAGIQVIRYRNPDEKHEELGEFFDDLRSFIPTEQEAPPVAPVVDGTVPSDLPAATKLEKEDAEAIRRVLNDHAAAILRASAPDKEKYTRYATFCKDYDEAIYRAWSVKTEPPRNQLLGYRLIDRVAKGAFGTVYRAQDDKGADVAIKVLHESIREQPEMLQGFRRGVRSMEILSQRHVSGVVPYRQAFEIPAFVVMDFVEGPSLHEAVKSQRAKEWSTVLRIAFDLASIIRRSHQLPERVLHRDIRPSNIMLRNGWQDESEWEVVVLDFDLSWHRDAHELSVSSPGTLNGYLAPEQVHRDPIASTRNAAVDSFGMGMTLLFLRTGVEPTFFQHRHHDWASTLRDYSNRWACPSWQSVPMRYFRLIDSATKHSQRERLDMSLILGELERLREAEQHPDHVRSAELLAEELASRTLEMPYTWNADGLSASVDSGGMRIVFEGLETQNRIRIAWNWQQTGAEHHRSVQKWVPEANKKIVALLRKGGWTIESATGGGYQVNGAASISCNTMANEIVKQAKVVGSALRQLEFK